MHFHNLNFKLVVLDALISLGYFSAELKTLTEKYWSWDNYDYAPIPEIYAFCSDVEITPAQLAEVKFLVFDGGLEIYGKLIPNWDGEDDQFDVDSLADIVKLQNLESLQAVSMLIADDIAPLLALASLKEIYWYDLARHPDNAARLRAKGILVRP